MFSKGSSKSNGGEAPRSTAPRPEQSAAPKSHSVPSIISADLKITGNLESSGDIQVDGNIQGDISSRTLTIGEAAHVKGSVMADSVRVCGHVTGEIKSASVVLAKTAKVDGDIAHQSLAIEAGAFIEGNIRRLEPETPKSDSKVAVISRTEVGAPASSQNGSTQGDSAAMALPGSTAR